MARLLRSYGRILIRKIRLGAAVSVTPGTAHLVLTGKTPTVATPRLVTPAVSHLVLMGHAPTVATPRVVVPGTAHLVLTGHAPTVASPRLVTPGTDHLLLTGHAPTVSTPVTVMPDTGHLVLTGYAPDVVVVPVAAVVVTPDTAHLLLTGYPPTVIATVTEAGPDTRYLRGVPSLGKPRRRPDVTELAGTGLIASFGAATLVGEAAFAADIQIPIEGTGRLVQDTVRSLAQAILLVGECSPIMEFALFADARAIIEGSVTMRAEAAVTGIGVIYPAMEALLQRETMIVGLGPIRSGGEAVLTREENEEALIVAAAELIIRLTAKAHTP